VVAAKVWSKVDADERNVSGKPIVITTRLQWLIDCQTSFGRLCSIYMWEYVSLTHFANLYFFPSKVSLTVSVVTKIHSVILQISGKRTSDWIRLQKQCECFIYIRLWFPDQEQCIVD
jgi:hypothetical protein